MEINEETLKDYIDKLIKATDRYIDNENFIAGLLDTFIGRIFLRKKITNHLSKMLNKYKF